MIGIKSDKILVFDGLFDGYLYVEDGKIAELSKEEKPCAESYDFTGQYVSPGFIDMHTHGAGGHAFMNSTPEDVIAGCQYHLAHGTTCILPTISAGAFPVMEQAVIHIQRAMESGKAPTVLGAHLEGPYLSKAQCGAQNTAFITPPVEEDYKRLLDEHGCAVKRWTYAPENDEKGVFCKYITSHGVIASAGHTDAVYADMQTALANGCNLITHLYSCTSTITRDHGFRRLGVLETAYLEDDIYVEIIADGKHLPPELLRLILKNKDNDKIALITDSLEIAGTDIKEGVMSGTEFVVEDGVCKLKDRSAFAGSVATADVLIRTMVQQAGCSVPAAVKMLTKVPAEILKVNKGELAVGKDADIVVFDENIAVQGVFLAGKKVH